MTDQALKIVYRDPAKLVGYEKNSRLHPPGQVAQIRRSIDEFGFTSPVLLRDDGKAIGAGHGRVAASLLDPPLAQVPTIIVPGLSDAQWRAYIIADNKLGLTSEWSMDLLKAELSDLQSIGFDLSFTGFDGLELRGLLGGVGAGKDPEETPPAPAVPVSRLGDLWILGDHRLIVGSSTDAAAVAQVLDGISPHLLVSDPPYGVSYDANWRNERVRSDGSPSDGRAIGKVVNDDQADWRQAYALFPGDVLYAWSADLHSREAIEAIEAAGFELRAQIIWAKTRFVIGRGNYHFQHEPAFYAVRKGGRSHWNGSRSQTTLWTIEHIKSETGHSTQKPVDCMKRPMENNSAVGDWVYDPFVGSGTSIIGAEMIGRRCAAVEIDPGYADVCVERWQNFSGGEARLQATGETFVQVCAQRKAPPARARRRSKKPTVEEAA